MNTELIPLPPSCTVTRRGLTLREGLSRDEWLGIGTKIGELAGATSWILGDFFAYGDQFYTNAKGAKQVPDGLYEKLATEIGVSYGTLANSKYVCTALPLSRRRERLTFGHAQEIVGRSEPKDYDKWIDLAVEGGLSIKALRERMRKATATHLEEPNDKGTGSFLETTRQYVRDYQAAADSKFTPAYRKELMKILAPVLKDLSAG
jgi:hypothetical protein